MIQEFFDAFLPILAAFLVACLMHFGYVSDFLKSLPDTVDARTIEIETPSFPFCEGYFCTF